jgi:hypothetical protein
MVFSNHLINDGILSGKNKSLWKRLKKKELQIWTKVMKNYEN